MPCEATVTQPKPSLPWRFLLWDWGWRWAVQVPFLLGHLAPCWAWTTGGAIETGRGGGRRDKLLPMFTVPVSPQQCLFTFIPVVAAEFTLQFCQLLENQLLHVPVGTLAPAGALSQSSLWFCTRPSSELRHSSPADCGGTSSEVCWLELRETVIPTSSLCSLSPGGDSSFLQLLPPSYPFQLPG